MAVPCMIGSERDVLLHSSSNVRLRENQKTDLHICPICGHTFNVDVTLIAADARPSSEYTPSIELSTLSDKSPTRCSKAKIAH